MIITEEAPVVNLTLLTYSHNNSDDFNYNNIVSKVGHICDSIIVVTDIDYTEFNIRSKIPIHFVKQTNFTNYLNFAKSLNATHMLIIPDNVNTYVKPDFQKMFLNRAEIWTNNKDQPFIVEVSDKISWDNGWKYSGDHFRTIFDKIAYEVISPHVIAAIQIEDPVERRIELTKAFSAEMSNEQIRYIHKEIAVTFYAQINQILSEIKDKEVMDKVVACVKLFAYTSFRANQAVSKDDNEPLFILSMLNSLFGINDIARFYCSQGSAIENPITPFFNFNINMFGLPYNMCFLMNEGPERTQLIQKLYNDPNLPVDMRRNLRTKFNLKAQSADNSDTNDNDIPDIPEIENFEAGSS